MLLVAAVMCASLQAKTYTHVFTLEDTQNNQLTSPAQTCKFGDISWYYNYELNNDVSSTAQVSFENVTGISFGTAWSGMYTVSFETQQFDKPIKSVKVEAGGGVSGQVEFSLGDQLIKKDLAENVQTIECTFAEDEANDLKIKFIQSWDEQKAFFVKSISVEYGSDEPAPQPQPAATGPLAIKSGFNQDVIAEGDPIASYINGSGGIDGYNFVFYSLQDPYKKGSIAGDDRFVQTNNGTPFTLAEYNQNNALIMTSGTDYTLELAEAKPFEDLYLLMTSTGGAGDVSITPIYEDDTEDTPTEANIADWSGTTGNVTGIGRINKNLPLFLITKEGFQLFEIALKPAKTQKVKAIKFSPKTAGRRTAVFAVSGKEAQVSTGLTTAPQNANRTLIGVYTLNGVKVAAPVKGINILKYSDGTTQKVVIK